MSRPRAAGTPRATARRSRPALPSNRPAFYANTGGLLGDLVAILHPPYTLWHLAYVVIGAAVAPTLDWTRLLIAVAAFFFGTGIAAHALDEWRDRPLRTRLSDRALLWLGLLGFAASVAVAMLGAFVISPWVLAWAAAGVLLAAGYALEWHRWLHSDLGFALTWGAFPALFGYWTQAEGLAVAALGAALTATALSLVQRALSTPARFVRRRARGVTVAIEPLVDDGNGAREAVADWSTERLLGTWERPLQLLTLAVIALAATLLLA